MIRDHDSQPAGLPNPPGMLHPSKQERIEELLRKSLLGEELINTQFHLFSARSLPSGRVSSLASFPRAPNTLWIAGDLFAKCGYWTHRRDLVLSSDINPSDPSLVDLADDHDIPSNARIDEYGYGSDSDLDDCNDLIPATRPKCQRTTSASKDDDELSDDGSESVSSDMFVMSPEQPREDGPFAMNQDGDGSIASSETAVQNTADNKTWKNQAAMRLRSLGSRQVLVKDTAFQTWYTLLNYLYTDQFNFLPLSSATPGGQPRESLTNSLDEPRCSAKSMYRLACKVGLEDLRDEAFSYIRSNLTERNILKELSCSLVSTHPELLEMELDMLYSHISSSPVVAGFPALARCIANKELPHGADIVIGIHTRFLKESRPLPWRPARSVRFSVPPAPAVVDDSARDALEVEGEDEIGATDMARRDTSSDSPYGRRVRGSSSIANVLPAAENVMPATALIKGPKRKWGKKATVPSSSLGAASATPEEAAAQEQSDTFSFGDPAEPPPENLDAWY
ncbi:hypothetical protein JVT61DRAFT_14311 [Boletus reticuloceps]|uniref:Uncharacterized protein n=1 Tax=Boletus reticuloceps TaxID=495285 RepID=A0A8I3A343_9AGAM|nr:hypothetical protein JVT61DRAFT_14311 [Boletus reticuloceps]